MFSIERMKCLWWLRIKKKKKIEKTEEYYTHQLWWLYKVIKFNDVEMIWSSFISRIYGYFCFWFSFLYKCVNPFSIIVSNKMILSKRNVLMRAFKWLLRMVSQTIDMQIFCVCVYDQCNKNITYILATLLRIFLILLQILLVLYMQKWLIVYVMSKSDVYKYVNFHMVEYIIFLFYKFDNEFTEA